MKIMVYYATLVDVFSEAAYHRESKTLDKKIKTEGDSQNKAWWHLSNQVFTCPDDACNQAEKQKKLLKFHEATFSIVEVKNMRPKGAPKQMSCQTRLDIKLNSA